MNEQLMRFQNTNSVSDDRSSKCEVAWLGRGRIMTLNTGRRDGVDGVSPERRFFDSFEHSL